MNTSTYAIYKAAGICTRCTRQLADPGRVACTPCRLREAQLRNPSLTLDEWQARVAFAGHSLTSPIIAAHIPGHAVGHCGQWWPMAALPVRCGACGSVAMGGVAQ